VKFYENVFFGQQSQFSKRNEDPVNFPCLKCDTFFMCKVYFLIYFVLFSLPYVCVLWLFLGIYFSFEIFTKLPMCYNLISGHVLVDFQMATVTATALYEVEKVFQYLTLSYCII